MRISQQAIALFQRQGALTADGIDGPQTLQNLQARGYSDIPTALNELTGVVLDQHGDPDWGHLGYVEGDEILDNQGVSGSFIPQGVIIHHTGGSITRERVNKDLLVHGRPDLRGPLVQVGINRDGTAVWITNGRAQHAGIGDGEVLRYVQGVPTASSLSVKVTPKKDDTYGNSHFLGIELQNSGSENDTFPQVQWERAVAIAAMWCKAFRWHAMRVIGHKEWTSRKVDPNFEMGNFRQFVQAKLEQKLVVAAAPKLSAEERIANLEQQLREVKQILEKYRPV